MIFTIPRLNDLLYYEAEGELGALADRLAAFAAREPGTRYFDVLPAFIADRATNGRRFEDYFLPCDGHWSPLGHAVAADFVRTRVGETGAPVEATASEASSRGSHP